jgi:hypothetical protein
MIGCGVLKVGGRQRSQPKNCNYRSRPEVIDCSAQWACYVRELHIVNMVGHIFDYFQAALCIVSGSCWNSTPRKKLIIDTDIFSDVE